MGCLLSKPAAEPFPHPPAPPSTPVRPIYPARCLMLLPNELLLEIAHYLTSTPDVYALLLVNRRLSLLLAHVLSARLLDTYNGHARHRLFSTTHSLSLVLRLLSLNIDLNAAVCNCFIRGSRFCHCGPPLHHAILDRNISMVSTLLDHGASATTRCSITGDTAVHYAIYLTEARSGHSKIPDDVDFAILVMLLSDQRLYRMNDSAARNAKGETWLHTAVRTSPRQKVYLVRPFLVPGLDVNVARSDMKTPLHLAVYDGRPDIAKLLLEHGAEHRTVDERGGSPWTKAFNPPICELIDLLLTHDPGLIRTPVNANGETAEECLRRSLVRILGREDSPSAYFVPELWNRTKMIPKLARLRESEFDTRRPQYHHHLIRFRKWVMR